MLHALEIENFRSFGDRTRIEFTVENPRKLDYRYVKRPCGVTVARLAVFMGANASGKTGILQAMNHLRWFISESNFVKDTADFIPPRAFFGTPQAPCRFSVEFDLGGKEIYRYRLAVVRGFHIAQESLERRQHRSDWQLVFGRTNTETGTVFAEGTSVEWRNAPQKGTATLISSITQGATVPGESPEGRTLAERMVEFVDRSFTNLPATWNDYSSRDEFTVTARILSENPDLLKTVGDFVVGADTGISKLAIGDLEIPGKDGQIRTIPVAEFSHTIDGKVIPFSFIWESSGTHGLTTLLTHTIPTVKQGGLVVLDEIERHLHPHLIPKVVRALLPHESSSQLFVVTHSDTLLREIDRRQLHLVEKKETGRSTCYRADRIKGLKSDRNLLAWYHTGALGGVPLL